MIIRRFSNGMVFEFGRDSQGEGEELDTGVRRLLR